MSGIVRAKVCGAIFEFRSLRTLRIQTKESERRWFIGSPTSIRAMLLMSLSPSSASSFLFARSAEFIIRLPPPPPPPPPFASIVLLSTAKIYSLPPSLRSWNLLQSFLSLPFPRLSGGKAARRLSSDLEGGGGGGDQGRWHREREREREEGGRGEVCVGK